MVEYSIYQQCWEMSGPSKGKEDESDLIKELNSEALYWNGASREEILESIRK